MNPFAFPSDTDFRFGLLVATVVGAGLFFFGWLFWSVPSLRAAGLANYQACSPLLQTTRDALVAALPNAQSDPSELTRASADYRACLAPGDRLRTAWTAGGTLLALSVAALLYWLAPGWVIRRRRLVPLPSGLPGLDEGLAELSREAGLARPPTFLWDPLNGSPTGLAFGRLGRYYVALSGGLVAQLFQNPAAFRAVVRHELAHLRNADVDKTYFAIAVAQAFALTAGLPFLISLAIALDGETIGQVGWRGLALAVLVYLSLAAVLRAREIYADLRASLVDGPSGQLGAILAAMPEPRTDRWRGAFAFHPSPAARRRALESTDHLMRLGFWEALATGIAATVALPNVSSMLSFVSVGPQQFLTGLSVAPLVAGVIGLGVWRAAFAALARQRPQPSTTDLALGLAVGVVIGRAISFDTAISTLPPGRSSSLLAFDLLCAGLLVAGLWLLLRWIALGALAWLASGASGRPLRLAYVAGLALAGGLLAAGLGQLLLTHDLGEAVLAPASGFDPAAVALVVGLFVGGTLLLAVNEPLVLAGFVTLWAFPLAAGRLRPAVAGRPTGWMYLDPAPDAAAPPATLVRLPEAILIGLRCALAFGVLLLALRVATRLLVSAEMRDADSGKLALYAAMIVLIWLVEAVAAWRATRRTGELGVPHGLLAAFVAGCIGAAEILGVNLLFGGSLDPAWVWQVFSASVGGGTVAALPAALLASRRRSGRPLVALPEATAT